MDTLKKTEFATKKVLVIEDDERIRTIVARTLENNGYLVLQASNGIQGVEQAEKADIVLLDMFLPGMSGQDVLKKVRSTGNYVPVVVMSAVLDKVNAEKSCEPYGIVDFIEKPFKAADLVEKVGHAASVADDLRFVRKATDRLKGFIDRQAQA